MGFWLNDLAAGGPILPVGIWVHLAFVYNMDAMEQRIYVDGECRGQRKGSRPLKVTQKAGRVHGGPHVK